VLLLPVDTVGHVRRPAQVHTEQPPNSDGNSAGRDVAQLHVTWFLPYRHDNENEHGQDDPARGEDSQDQRGKHQFSAPLPKI